MINSRRLTSIVRITAIFVPFFLFSVIVAGQDRIKAPVKLKIEDGDFESVSVVLKNNTSGESNTIPGVAKFDLDLKMNSDYIISFMKPGYITKRIAFNTKAPAERMKDGFYAFNFEVNLFKQYDGVNIVVFNQPVGKIAFNRLIDDFDYDTDYTKQIQSALKLAEDEIRKKQEEEKVQTEKARKEAAALAEQNRKEEEKRKQEEAANARAELKAKQEADKKATQEAKELALEEARQKKIEEEKRVQLAKANEEEEKRQGAIAKMEQEERDRLKAAEAEEKRTGNAGTSGSELPAKTAQANTGDDIRRRADSGGGVDSNSSGSGGASGSDRPGGKAGTAGDEERNMQLQAEANKGQEKGISKAVGTEGSDDRKNSAKLNPLVQRDVNEETYEKLPDMEVEEIVETNRVITRVTVRNNQKETVFSKVVYNWGGVYYFRSNLSISESLYKMRTGLR